MILNSLESNLKVVCGSMYSSAERKKTFEKFKGSSGGRLTTYGFVNVHVIRGPSENSYPFLSLTPCLTSIWPCYTFRQSLFNASGLAGACPYKILDFWRMCSHGSAQDLLDKVRCSDSNWIQSILALAQIPVPRPDFLLAYKGRLYLLVRGK